MSEIAKTKNNQLTAADLKIIETAFIDLEKTLELISYCIVTDNIVLRSLVEDLKPNAEKLFNSFPSIK